jgi:hypothetical protein
LEGVAIVCALVPSKGRESQDGCKLSRNFVSKAHDSILLREMEIPKERRVLQLVLFGVRRAALVYAVEVRLQGTGDPAIEARGSGGVETELDCVISDGQVAKRVQGVCPS